MWKHKYALYNIYNQNVWMLHRQTYNKKGKSETREILRWAKITVSKACDTCM